jgi:serine phosphatase RsbU (regulator of sigma subunit)
VLVIGDVIGHDVKAAAGMSQLRGVLRGIGHTTGAQPAEILRRTDEADEGLLMRAVATVLVATLRPVGADTGDVEVCWSSAGHPPPVVVRSDGRVGVLTDAERGSVQPDLLLGVDAAAERHDHRAVVPAGSTLLLYTDGLVERRGEDLDEGIARLVGVLRDRVGLGLAELCDEVLSAMLPDDPEDDVALVAIRVTGDPRPGNRSSAGPTAEGF